jgi:hypothetical protein
MNMYGSSMIIKFNISNEYIQVSMMIKFVECESLNKYAPLNRFLEYVSHFDKHLTD